MVNKISMANLKKPAGRPKGSQNKTTRVAKDMIENAAELLGGVDRMVAWAKEDPANERTFWGSMFVKLMPVQVANPEGETFKTEDTGAGAAKLLALIENIAERRGTAG